MIAFDEGTKTFGSELTDCSNGSSGIESEVQNTSDIFG